MGKKVLIVDAAATMHGLVVRGLRRPGLDAWALRDAERSDRVGGPGAFDLILTDVDLESHERAARVSHATTQVVEA
jgi:hypothetical protein